MPVIDHWWQTETGWPIGANCLGIEQLPVKHGSCTRAVPGWDVRVLEAEADGEARELKPGEIGALAVKLPLPPGALPTLWQQDERFVQSYLSAYPGYYQTADAGFIDEDGYIQVMTRTDDIINVAGHRLSTGGIEEVVAAHPDVAECAVMGVADPLKGQVPLGLVVLKAGVARPPDAIEEEVVGLVRERIGPVASFKTALVVERPAEDPVGQNPARHDAPHRRRRGLPHAGDDRRPGDPGGDRRGAGAGGVSAEEISLSRMQRVPRGKPSRVRLLPRRRPHRPALSRSPYRLRGEGLRRSRPARSLRCRRAPLPTGRALAAQGARDRVRRVPRRCTGRARPGGAA